MGKSSGNRGYGSGKWFGALPALAGFLLLAAGCGKQTSMESVDSDANGYLCQKCNAKVYTPRKVFLEKCPKCSADALADVVGYFCVKDQHLTLRPKISGPAGAAVCEKCQTPLKSAMVSPREKDLQAWGAEKTTATK